MQNFETCPAFLKFGVIRNENTFTIQTADGTGTYKIFVRATIFNPYTNSTLTDSSFSFIIEVVPPSTFVTQNSPPSFLNDPSKADIVVPINVRFGEAEETF
jgi:hypothetical protein